MWNFLTIVARRQIYFSYNSENEGKDEQGENRIHKCPKKTYKGLCISNPEIAVSQCRKKFPITVKLGKIYFKRIRPRFYDYFFHLC
jgi:hypothetical protein